MSFFYCNLQAHKAKALRNRNTGNKTMYAVLIIRRKTKYAVWYLAKGKPSY
jgi:hypothetical protein